MIDRIFSAALTFCLLTGGTLAIGSAVFEVRPAAAAAQERVVQLRSIEVPIVQMPAVEIRGKRFETATSVARRDRNEPATSDLQ